MLVKLQLILCVFISISNAAPYHDNHAKVLILGAGAAGLQAARVLHDNGMDDFLVIEGADYLGGRMKAVEFGGVVIEQGANWAQPGDAPIIDIIRNMDLSRHMSDWDSMVLYNASGYDVSDESDSSWMAIDAAHTDLYNRAERIVTENLPDMSQRAALRLADWMPTTPLEKAIEWFEFDFEWADRPEVTSLQSTALLPAAENVYIVTDPRGFAFIFDDIVNFLLHDPTYKYHVRLNQVVTSIDQQDAKNPVVVTCADGTKYTGEYILVTFSLGVLQNNFVDFLPALPEWKVQAFSQFLMASFSKIFIQFPAKFWGNEEWIIHANERRGYFPLFMNAEAAGLFPSGTNMLLTIVTGEEARRIESQPDWETKAEVEQVLRNIYGVEKVPDASDIFISGWEHNPLTMGSYTNWPVEMSVSAFKYLESKVERIFFGGEGTDPVYNGYVQGGLDSGNREALKILACIAGSPDCAQMQYNPDTDYESPCDAKKSQIWKPRRKKKNHKKN